MKPWVQQQQKFHDELSNNVHFIVFPPDIIVNPTTSKCTF